MPPWLIQLFTNPTVVTCFITAVGGFLGALITFAIAKVNKKPEAQTVLNNGFQRFIDELQEERKAWNEERQMLQGRCDQNAIEIANLRRSLTINSLRVMQLEGLMQTAGIPIPAAIAPAGEMGPE